jgi:hypothetical protein
MLLPLPRAPLPPAARVSGPARYPIRVVGVVRGVPDRCCLCCPRPTRSVVSVLSAAYPIRVSVLSAAYPIGGVRVVRGLPDRCCPCCPRPTPIGGVRVVRGRPDRCCLCCPRSTRSVVSVLSAAYPTGAVCVVRGLPDSWCPCCPRPTRSVRSVLSAAYPIRGVRVVRGLPDRCCLCCPGPTDPCHPWPAPDPWDVFSVALSNLPSVASVARLIRGHDVRGCCAAPIHAELKVVRLPRAFTFQHSNFDYG